MLLALAHLFLDACVEMIKNTLTSGFSRFFFPVLFPGCLFVSAVAGQQVATEFTPSGVAGGGRILSVTVNPDDPTKAFAVCDMMGVYRTEDEGLSWRAIPTDTFAGSFRTRMQYAGTGVNQRVYGIKRLQWGSNKTRPAVSADGGVTWTELAQPSAPYPADAYYSMVVDPAGATAASQRMVMDNYTKLWFSATGGTTAGSWSLIHERSGSNPESVRLAGVVWDGSTIYVGTNVGLFRSNNAGTTWAPFSYPGLPGGAQIVEFCGAKAVGGGAVTLFATTIDSLGMFSHGTGKVEGWVNQYEIDEVDRYLGLYSVDTSLTTPSWVSRPGTGGVPFARVDVPASNSARPWAATSRKTEGDSGGGVYKGTVSGGTWTWARCLEGSPSTSDNVGVSTGYQGDGGILSWDWSYPTLGLDVSDADPDRVIVSGDYPYVTDDGGGSWMQMYVNPATENVAGSAILRPRAYHHSGLGVTTGHWLHWVSREMMLGANTDVGLQRSADGGVTWTTDYTPLDTNGGLDTGNWYALAKQPGSSRIYAALANINDFYEPDRLDSEWDDDTKRGDVRYSDDNGQSWVSIGGGVVDTAILPFPYTGRFPGPVVGLAVDPANASHIYAASASSQMSGSTYLGGIYRSTDGGTTWNKLTSPPDNTIPNPDVPKGQGRPLSIHVIGTNELVATFCARQDGNGVHLASSGVFYSSNGGSSWVSRSHSNMDYYTRDLVVDPGDSQRWFVAVQGTKTNTDPAAPTFDGLGGVYRTTDKGLNWVNIFTSANGVSAPVSDAVQSVTYVPGTIPLLYVTTSNAGLWVSSNPNATTPPTFTRVTSFPFARARRVFVDPYRTDGTIWVTTQGGGLWRGTARRTMKSSILRNGLAVDFQVDVSDTGTVPPTLFGIAELPTPATGGTWSNLGLTATTTALSAGVTRYTWTGVNSHTLFAGLNGGFVRATRTRADGTSEVCEVGGWVKEEFSNSQMETWGVPWLKPASDRGRAVTLGNKNIPPFGFVAEMRLEAPYDGGFGAGKEYYLEIEEGAFEGHRFEVVEGASSGRVLILDPGHVRNTRSPVPVLNGERVCLREHWTMDEIFPKGQFLATNDPATADRIIFYEGGIATVYWLLNVGGNPRWVLQGDGFVGDRGSRVVAVGEGAFVDPKASVPSVVRTLWGVGMVRQGVFRQPLALGIQMTSLGFPVTHSFVTNSLMTGDGFSFGLSAAFSDNVLVWRGDKTPWVTGYEPTYIFFGSATFNPAYWVQPPSFVNLNNIGVFPKHRAHIIRARTVAKPMRRVLMPWVP